MNGNTLVGCDRSGQLKTHGILDLHIRHQTNGTDRTSGLENDGENRMLAGSTGAMKQTRRPLFPQ